MRKIIAKISGLLATLSVIAIGVSYFIPEVGYVFWGIGIVVLVISGIAYLATGVKIREWFWKLMEMI